MVLVGDVKCTIDAADAEGDLVEVDCFIANQSAWDPGMFDPAQFSPVGPNDFADVSASIDDAKRRVLQPRANDVGVQRIGIRLRLEDDGQWNPMFFDPEQFEPGGLRMDPLLVGPVEITRSLDSAIQTASGEFAKIDGRPPLGDELLLGAPATGLRSWNVSVAYRDANHVPFEEPVITNGMADDTRTVSGRAKTQTLQLADAGRRTIGKLATLIIPPGSNLRRDRVAELLAKAGGETLIDLPVMDGNVLKPVDLAQGDWRGLAQAIVDVAGFRLLQSRSGAFSAKRFAVEQPRPPIKWLFTEADIVAAADGSPQTFEKFAAPEAWTSIEMRGTRQVTRGADCGIQSTQLRGFGLVTVIGPAKPFRQTTGGSVSASGATEQTYGSPVIGSETIKNVSESCREIVSERTRVWGYVNPTRARYQRNTSGTIVGYNHCYLEANDAEAIGYANGLPHRIQVSEVTLNRLFFGGDLVKEIETTRSLYIPRRHVKHRSARTDDWETAVATSNWWDLGDGTGLTDSAERLIVTERTTTDYQNGSDGYLRERVTRVERYAKRQGYRYLYGDGSESSDSEETFMVVEETREQWTPIREGLYAETVLEYGIGGRFLDGRTETKFGGPPGVVTLEDAAPKRENFETDDEFNAALAASRFEQEEISVVCNAPALLDVRPEHELPQAFSEWAENELELGWVCDRQILLGTVGGVAFTLACNARLEEGDVIHVRNRPERVDHDFIVTEVRHTVGVQVPSLTRVTAIAWPEVVN